MEEKKEKLKFLKNVSEKFKSLDAKRKKLLIIISIILLVLIVITIVTSVIFSQVVGSAGKVAGNLRNSGFAVEKGNKAYVAASSTVVTGPDVGTLGLYEVSSDNTTKLIDENENVKSINVYKGYLYYLTINKSDSGNYIRQVVKIKPNGEKKEVLVDNIETTSIGQDSLNVSDGWVYFLNADSKLEKVKANNKDKRQPVSDEEISYFQISGKYIYYTTRDDEFKRMKKDGSSIERLGNGIDTFQIVSNEVYYISKSNSNLMKLNIDDNTDETVVAKKVKAFNVYKKNIYYAVNEDSEKAIYGMKINGKKNEKIVDLDSEVTEICVVGKWLYYTDKLEDSPYYYRIYKVKTNGEDKQVINF